MSDIINARLSPLAFNAFKSLPSSNSGVPQDLPTSEEMIKFKTFLVNAISSTPKTPKYRRRLAELTVGRLILFNRRRASEVSNLKVSQWRQRSMWKKDAEDAKLSEEELKLVKEMELVYVIGKGRKFVPVLFPNECVAVTNWLACNMADDEYVFSTKAGKPLRGTVVLKSLSAEAGLNGLKSTKFRKFTATSLQVLAIQYFTEFMSIVPSKSNVSNLHLYFLIVIRMNSLHSASSVLTNEPHFYSLVLSVSYELTQLSGISSHEAVIIDRFSQSFECEVNCRLARKNCLSRQSRKEQSDLYYGLININLVTTYEHSGMILPAKMMFNLDLLLETATLVDVKWSTR